MDAQTNTPLLVDYYPGAYGPTIHVALKSHEHLTRLLRIFQPLAESETEVNLHALPEVQLSNLQQFELSSTPGDDTAPKSLTLVTGNGGKARWTQSQNAWARTIRLVEIFMKDNTSGHQYLTKEGIDDAIVEVAYRE